MNDQETRHKVFHSNTKLIMSHSDIDKAFESMRQSVITN